MNCNKCGCYYGAPMFAHGQVCGDKSANPSHPCNGIIIDKNYKVPKNLKPFTIIMTATDGVAWSFVVQMPKMGDINKELKNKKIVSVRVEALPAGGK